MKLTKIRPNWLKISLVFLSIIVYTLLFLYMMIFAYHYFVKKFIFPIKFNEQVDKYSLTFEIDPILVYSIIKAESNFNSNCVSPVGAVGLMQITPKTAEYISKILNVETYDLFNPDDNVKFGCFYVKYLSNKFLGLKEILCAYNAGEGNVSNWLKDKKYSLDGKTLIKIPFSETNDYVKKVSKNLTYYKKYYNKLLDKQK